MRTPRTTPARFGSLAVLAGLVVGAPAAAQEHAAHGEMAMPASGVRADLIRDLEFLEEKYTSLAESMTPHYAWRPGEGVRSVSEVFMHVAGANLYIPTTAGVAPPEGMEVASMEEAFGRMQEMERVTDPARVQQHLREGLAHARHAIATVPDEELDAPITLFGQPATKRSALIVLVTHMHEHLGQAVAYARTNGVVPPWSEGG